MDNAAYIIELARSGRSKCSGGVFITLRAARGTQRKAARSAQGRVTRSGMQRAQERLALLQPFRLTFAPARTACKELIALGELRFGSVKLGGPFGADQTWLRCMDCVTGKQAANVTAKFPAGVSSVPVRRSGRASRAASTSARVCHAHATHMPRVCQALRSTGGSGSSPAVAWLPGSCFASEL